MQRTTVSRSASALIPNISFPPNFQQGDPFSFPGVGLGKTLLYGVNLRVLHTSLKSKRPKVHLKSSRGQPGSNFHIWVQNPMEVLTTKFYPYSINTSQFIPLLRSIVTFSGKRLLTPEGVAGGFSLTRGLFWGLYLMSLCHRSSFRVNCLFPVYGVFFQVLIASNPTTGFGSYFDTRRTLVLPMLSRSFSSLRSVGSEKRLPEVGVGAICIGHSTGSRGPGGLGF